jgi:hypothetical protein
MYAFSPDISIDIQQRIMLKNPHYFSDRLYYNENKVDGCVWGVYGSGDYELTTSYLDYDSDRHWARTATFIGLDIKLL